MADILALVEVARLLISQWLERLIGRQSGVKRLPQGLAMPLHFRERPRKDVIARTAGFREEGVVRCAVAASA